MLVIWLPMKMPYWGPLASGPRGRKSVSLWLELGGLNRLICRSPWPAADTVYRLFEESVFFFRQVYMEI